MLSMYISLFCETTYLSEHESSLECHTFVLEKLFFSRLINDSLFWNATGNWPRYSQRPFGHSATYSPMWSPESLSRILASVNGSSSLVVCRSGHKQCSPLNSCHMQYSSHVSGITCLLPFTGLASSLSLRDSQYKKKCTRRMALIRSPKDQMTKPFGNS